VRRGKLREERHAERFARVEGIILGMTNKLTNLSERLAKHLAGFRRRIDALRAAGFNITVEEEFAAAQEAVGKAQTRTVEVLQAIRSIPDSETPRVVAREVRLQVRRLRTEVFDVRSAFRRLQRAIRADVRQGRPTPSPGVTPSPVPSPSPVI
jgi:predicted  nucleic acid-binding Zn-ribbon protein